MCLGRAASFLLALLVTPLFATAQPLPAARISLPEPARLVISNPAESPLQLRALRIDAEVRELLRHERPVHDVAQDRLSGAVPAFVPKDVCAR